MGPNIMSLPLYSMQTSWKMLLLQLVAFLLIGLLFTLKDTSWSVSAMVGGLVAWLPNVIFMVLAQRIGAKIALKNRIAWGFAIAEASKVCATIILLIVALVVFDTAFMPLGLTWLSVLIVQIVAPTVINNKR